MVLMWWPTACVLQLNLSKTNPDGIVRAGSAYSGTSTIRYVKREPCWASPAENPQALAADSVDADLSAYDQFLRAVQGQSGNNGEGGLPLHAYTTKSARYPDVVPLQVQGYKVTEAGSGNPLKLLSVTEMDATAKGSGSSAASAKPLSKSKSKQPQPGGKRKDKTAEAKRDSTLTGEGKAPAEAAAEDAINVVGAKWVVFHGADTLASGSEVELTVTFTGTVQASDQGGLYAGAGNDGLAVLTHFEVSLARFAFPCPDHPQYRLDWQLKTLQLPNAYTEVITNGTELTRKDLSAQSALQYSYTPCGPLPAYVFAFACFRNGLDSSTASSPLLMSEGVVRIPRAHSYADRGGVDAQTRGESLDGHSDEHIPLRVLATRQSGIPLAVLDQSRRTAEEAIRLLQEFFQSPLPLLQCAHIDILLAPTMPYISGMEHHCCLFLNESIFQNKGRKTGGGAANALEEQTALIVHELAHHWMGNALGLPFSVKEGVCQLLEQCLGDVIGGRPMRKYHHGSEVAEEVAQPQETVQGKEFTGHTYQHALLALQRLVGTAGFAAFEAHSRALVRRHLLDPMVRMEAYGGLDSWRLSTSPDEWPCAPYLSTTDAMRVLSGASHDVIGTVLARRRAPA